MGNLKLDNDILQYEKFVIFQKGLIELINEVKNKKADADINIEKYFELFHKIYESLQGWGEDFICIVNIYYDYLKKKDEISYDKDDPISYDKDYERTFSEYHYQSDIKRFRKMKDIFDTKGMNEFFTNIIFCAASNKKPLEIVMCRAESFKFSFDEQQDKIGKLHVTFPKPDIDEISPKITSFVQGEQLNKEIVEKLKVYATKYQPESFQENDPISKLNNYFGLPNSEQKFEESKQFDWNGTLVQILVNILFLPKGLKHLYFLPALCLEGVPGVGGFILATKANVEEDHIKYLLYLVTTAYEKLSSRLLKKYADDIHERTKRIAIISILVDSFAHNIAAHSLSAIVWFLKQQRQKPIDSDLPYDICKKKFSDLKKGIENSAEKQPLLDLIKEIDNNFVKITPMEGSAQFARYLTHKAAFWSGVTRDFECGGEIRTWYDVIKDFADNLLFLGTIAQSEGIHKVKIKVGYGGKGSAHKTKEFAAVDLSYMFEGTKKVENKGVNDDLKEKLRKNEWRLFLPNGIVGQHALYTIFENTIRNIKHAHPNELYNAKKEGLEFNIFIESVDDQHFNTTIWLGNKSKIREERTDEKGNVVKVGVDERIGQLLEEDIVSDNGTPRMGGNSQDKICASMLYNNVFSKVDVNDQDNPKPTHPWIHVERDLENEEKLGVIKRSFSVWKGAAAVEIIPDATAPEAVKRITSAISSDDKAKIVKIKVGELKYENPARFKFVITPNIQKSGNMSELELKKLKKLEELEEELAEKGIVRIMEKLECSGEDLDSLYKAWNKKWIKCDKKVYIVRRKTAVSSISSENKNTWVTAYHPGKNEDTIKGNSIICRFCHDANDKPPKGKAFLARRSHCVLSTKFTYLGEEKNSFQIKEKEIGHEFIETLLTNIEIYDNRIFDRVSSREKIELYSKQLFLYVHNEDIKNIKPYKKDDKANFIIIHLSYIESLGFKEANINDFIHKFFVDDNSKEEFLGSNSKLVITTGRGRGEWHNSLKQYKPHVLFKPIDSLLNAVEDGLVLDDDFQVKYNLVKILFGS